MPKPRYRVTIAKKRPSDSFDLTPGWEVRVNGISVGSVAPLHNWKARDTFNGWYMAIRDDELGIPLRNTAGEIGVPEEDVKKAAVAYVKLCLARKIAAEEGTGT